MMVCHWTGIHWNGQELGFKVFQEVVRRLHARFDNLLWMKLSELARYWAAKELTRIEKLDGSVVFDAPFASPDFTVKVPARAGSTPSLSRAGTPLTLREVSSRLELRSGTWFREANDLIVCFDLAKGRSQLNVS